MCNSQPARQHLLLFYLKCDPVLFFTKAITHVEGTGMEELEQQIEANIDGPRDTNTQEESSMDDEFDHDPR